jgi:hypothetical protein
MLNGVNGFYIAGSIWPAAGSGYFVQEATYPFGGAVLPPGTAVYASIALSGLGNYDLLRDPVSPSAATAWILQWRVYNPDGTVSDPIFTDLDSYYYRNIVYIPNCASITFRLDVVNCGAVAQVSVFNL